MSEEEDPYEYHRLDPIKTTNVDWILSLVERGVIEFVGEPVQTENGFEYTFKFIKEEK
jgi:hypothetical protein